MPIGLLLILGSPLAAATSSGLIQRPADFLNPRCFHAISRAGSSFTTRWRWALAWWVRPFCSHQVASFQWPSAVSGVSAHRWRLLLQQGLAARDRPGPGG